MPNTLLSICIPTYNRCTVLKATINSIVSQKEFDNNIELVISDNFSNDETYNMVQSFRMNYPNIKYIRNNENIGAEKNIFNVLSLGEGKFLKLVNDYSVFTEGSLKKILEILNRFEKNHSVIFFSNMRFNLKAEITECKDFDDFIKTVSYSSTWILCFGIWKSEFDLLKNETFQEFNFPHLDLLLRNLKMGYKPIIFNALIITNQTLPLQGGYNLFETFIQNYLTLLSQFVGKNEILKRTIQNEKRKLLFEFVFPWYCSTIIEKNINYNFNTEGVKFYLKKYFSFQNIILFTLKTSIYRVKRIMILIIKKIIFKPIARTLYFILSSSYYKDLEQPNQTEKLKFFGKNSILPPHNYIKNPQYVSIGNNFNAKYNLRIEVLDEMDGGGFNPEIIIGNGVNMNGDIHIECINKIVIGNNVLLVGRILISDYQYCDEYLTLSPKHRKLISKGPVFIKDNVLIGEGVVILGGVTIGENAIIGANSVIKTDVPANSVISTCC